MTAQFDQHKLKTTAEEKVVHAIEDIKGRMDCPKNFECVRSNFDNLCQARDFGLKNYVECCEADPQRCGFALSFGETYFCKCPMRVYIAKTLRK
jgi:hypothetical protein